ncbi:transposase [Halanaerocella petrolearia]
MKQKYNGKSMRLKNYDYSKSGHYFVTICSSNRNCIFGKINDNKIKLNKYGQIADDYWSEIPQHFDNVKLDQHIIMPNHIHGIIIIKNNNCRNIKNNDCRDMACHVPTTTTKTTKTRKFGNRKSGTLSTIIGSYKSAVTKKTNQIRNTPGNSIWQRNYYDRIIRSEDELNRIGTYIRQNPLKWELDNNSPVNL